MLKLVATVAIGAVAAFSLAACSSGDDHSGGENVPGETLPSTVATAQPAPEPPSHVIVDDLPGTAGASQERATLTPPAEPISDERPTPPLPHSEEADPSTLAPPGAITTITVQVWPPPRWRPLSDAAICNPGDRLGVPEDRSQFVCMVVVGADDCLELRAYPSFEGEVLDCLPSGTRLLESQRDFSGPHQTEDGVVWHLLRTAEGEWLGWAEAQFLKGTASFRNPSWKISLRRPSAVGVCVPGDPLAFDDPEPRFQYGIFSCLAVAGVDDCLEVREKPGLDARKLDCVPDGTRLLEVQSSPIAVEDTDGVAWRSVRWADGRWAGWVNSHHLDGPAPTTVVPAGQLLPTVEFPDDVALIASPFPRAGVPRGWGPTELVRIYQRLGQGLVIETLFHANNFYWTADGTVLGGYVCLGNHDPMSRACTGEETAHYESRDGGVTLERFVLSSQASLDYLGDYIGDARFRADDIDLRISDQLHFLPSFLSPSTSYKVGDLLGGAAESVSGVFSADHEMHWALHWPTIRNVETGEEWPIAFPAELLMLGDSFIPRLVLHGPFLRVVGVEEDCLPVRRQPSHHADELDCVAGRVLLQDQGDTATDDAITWRRVKTPAGIAGWADAKYLGQ